MSITLTWVCISLPADSHLGNLQPLFSHCIPILAFLDNFHAELVQGRHYSAVPFALLIAASAHTNASSVRPMNGAGASMEPAQLLCVLPVRDVKLSRFLDGGRVSGAGLATQLGVSG